MSFWEKVKKDLQKGVKEGIAAVKGGAAFVMEKAEELTEEGKRRYKLMDLKAKVQKEVADLGGKVYDLSFKVKNPLADAKIKGIISKIKKLETDIKKLEEGLKVSVKKKAFAKRGTLAKKITQKKAAPKSTVEAEGKQAQEPHK